MMHYLSAGSSDRINYEKFEAISDGNSLLRIQVFPCKFFARQTGGLLFEEGVVASNPIFCGLNYWQVDLAWVLDIRS
jgi:hypothetical protein